jgi:hypothetical protein
MAKTMIAVGLLAALASCGSQNVSSEVSCSSSACPPNLPFFGSGNYRSCHEISDPSSCYLETGDGVIYDCTGNCDCTTAQSSITQWCNTLQ